MATEPTPPSLQAFKPGPNEKEASQWLFNKADTESLGVLTGDLAVPFFQHSSLPPSLLGEIWQISDPENSGFLTPERFGVACRLIGHAQARGGSAQVREWVGTPGPFPKFEGFAIPSHLGTGAPASGSASASPSPAPQTAPAALQQQGTGSTAGVSITPDERTRYAKLFANSGPFNGLLDGEKARDIFIKSKLPFDTLGQIWNLADTRSRGSLDLADFTIGMHLIQHTMNGHLPSLPSVLNPALYASASNLPLPGVGAARGPGAGASQPTSPLRQSSLPVYNSPQQQQQPQQYQQQQQQPSQAWDITAQEKTEADGYFDGLDTARKGAIEGEAAVGFFGLSGLDMSELAKVWDLADIRQTGALNKDEFAVALKLIRDRVAGKPLPDALPSSLMPPSLRQGGQQQPSGPQRDLLDLMDDDPVPAPAAAAPTPFSAPQSAIFPQSTGSGFQPQPQRTLSPQPTGSFQQQQRSLSPQATGSQPYALQGTIFPQATGQSAQGSRSLSPQATGGFGDNFAAQQHQQHQQPAQPQPQQTSSSFFDDNDDADTKASLSAASVQLASLKSSHAETTQAVTSASTSRAELEQQLSSTTREINELQVSLSTARAAHEAERTMVDELRQKNEEQKALLVRARTELITAESDLSALRVERTEIEGGYLRDKEEVRECKRRLGEVGAELQTLKATLEKVKKEARQQRGMVAISKKQVVTAEGEREKVEKELKEAEREAINPVAVHVKEEEDDSPFDFAPASSTFAAPALAATATAAAASALPLPRSNVVSPAASVRSTNPFDRLGGGIATRALEPQQTGGSTVAQPALSRQGSEVHEPHVKTAEHEVTRSAEVDGQAAGKEGSNLTSTMAAVAGGAVAAVGAVGAGVASLWNSSDPKEDEQEVKKEEDTTDAFPSTSATSSNLVEKDPFGLPVAPAAASTSNTAFDSFGGGFGDDFATSDAPAAASFSAHDSAAFDDAFGDSSPSPVVAAPIDGAFEGQKQMSSALQDSAPNLPQADAPSSEESFNAPAAPIDGPFHESTPAAPSNEAFATRDEPDSDLAASTTETDVSSSLPSTFADPSQTIDDPAAQTSLLHATGAETSTAEESDNDNVFASPAVRSQTGDAEDSSDEDDEVEDAGPSRYASTSARSIGGEGEEEVTKDSPAVPTSTSDSGESFVHVPSSREPHEEDPAVATQFPAVEALEHSAPTREAQEETAHDPSTTLPGALALPDERATSPSSDQDTFEDAPAGSSAEPASPSTVTAPAPLATESLTSTEQPAIVSPTSHRRAPPPPPVSRSSLPVATPVAAPASSGAFHDTYGGDTSSSFPSVVPPSAESNNDDFNSAFADLGPAVPASSSSPFGASSSAVPTGDDFDSSFDFDDQFTESTAAPGAFSSTSAPAADFESSFADFDQSYQPSPAADRPSTGSFGSGAPVAMGAPVTRSAPDDEVKEDDVAGVKQIVGMGFNRQQAIEALEQSNYNVTKAINSLLG